MMPNYAPIFAPRHFTLLAFHCLGNHLHLSYCERWYQWIKGEVTNYLQYPCRTWTPQLIQIGKAGVWLGWCHWWCFHINCMISCDWQIEFRIICRLHKLNIATQLWTRLHCWVFSPNKRVDWTPRRSTRETTSFAYSNTLWRLTKWNNCPSFESFHISKRIFIASPIIYRICLAVCPTISNSRFCFANCLPFIPNWTGYSNKRAYWRFFLPSAWAEW